MAIKASTTDYTGRKRDVSINYGVSADVPGAHPVILKFGKISAYCAGVQKLVQRYMIAFLTIAGSQPNYPTFGTNFLKELQNENLVSAGDLIHIFNFANVLVLEQFREYQANHAEDPDDEKLSTALLNDVNVVGDAVMFDIKIYTDAGDEVNFLIPLPKQK